MDELAKRKFEQIKKAINDINKGRNKEKKELIQTWGLNDILTKDEAEISELLRNPDKADTSSDRMLISLLAVDDSLQIIPLGKEEIEAMKTIFKGNTARINKLDKIRENREKTERTEQQEKIREEINNLEINGIDESEDVSINREIMGLLEPNIKNKDFMTMYFPDKYKNYIEGKLWALNEDDKRLLSKAPKWKEWKDGTLSEGAKQKILTLTGQQPTEAIKEEIKDEILINNQLRGKPLRERITPTALQDFTSSDNLILSEDEPKTEDNMSDLLVSETVSDAFKAEEEKEEPIERTEEEKKEAEKIITKKEEGILKTIREVNAKITPPEKIISECVDIVRTLESLLPEKMEEVIDGLAESLASITDPEGNKYFPDSFAAKEFLNKLRYRPIKSLKYLLPKELKKEIKEKRPLELTPMIKKAIVRK